MPVLPRPADELRGRRGLKAASPEIGREVARDLGRLLLVAGAVRLWVVLLTYTIKGDSAGPIGMARALAAGRWDRFLAEPQQPLFSVLLVLGFGVARDWIWAGKLVGWILTTLTVPAVYLWVRRVATRAAGLGAGLLVALHPEFAEFAGAILTEGPYFFFYAIALWLVARGAATRSIVSAAGAGVGIAGCYLSRPEGILLLSIAPLALWLERPSSEGWRRQAALWLALGLAFASSAAPYVAVLSWQRGYPALTPKKGAEIFSGLRFKDPEPAARIPEPAVGDATVASRVDALLSRLRSSPTAADLQTGGVDPHGREAPDANLQTVEQTYYRRALRKEASRPDFIPLEFLDAYHPLLAVFLGVGLAVGLGSPGRSAGWMGALVAAFGALLCWNNWTHHYVSSRHLLSMAFPCLAWSGAGFAAAGAWGARRLERIRDDRPRLAAIGRRLASRGPVAIAAVVCALVLLPDTLRPEGRGSLDRVAIGSHIAEHGGRDRIVMTADGKVSFYADAEYLVVTAWGGYRELLSELVRYDVPYLILDEAEIFKVEELVEIGWLEPIPPVPGTAWTDESKLRVYRVDLPR